MRSVKDQMTLCSKYVLLGITKYVTLVLKNSAKNRCINYVTKSESQILKIKAKMFDGIIK